MIRNPDCSGCRQPIPIKARDYCIVIKDPTEQVHNRKALYYHMPKCCGVVKDRKTEVQDAIEAMQYPDKVKEERYVSWYLSWVVDRHCPCCLFGWWHGWHKETRATERRFASALAKKWKHPYFQMVQYVKMQMNIAIVLGSNSLMVLCGSRVTWAENLSWMRITPELKKYDHLEEDNRGST